MSNDSFLENGRFMFADKRLDRKNAAMPLYYFMGGRTSLRSLQSMPIDTVSMACVQSFVSDRKGTCVQQHCYAFIGLKGDVAHLLYVYGEPLAQAAMIAGIAASCRAGIHF